MSWSERDSKNLERIADALEKIMNSTNNLSVRNELHTESPLSLEASFFERITKVYIDEESVKREKGLKRKSAIRVSRNLTSAVTNFFEEQLVDFEVYNDDAYIICSGQDGTKALIRFFTDIGFYRAGAFYDEITKVAQHAQIIDVPLENVFVIISSLINSLEGFHVKSILGVDAPDNAVLLTEHYRADLEQFLEKYVLGVAALPDPKTQIIFLAADTHPNVAAWEYTTEGKPLPLNTKWLRPSIMELVHKLSTL